MIGVFFEFPTKNCPQKTYFLHFLPEKLTILSNYLFSRKFCYALPHRPEVVEKGGNAQKFAGSKNNHKKNFNFTLLGSAIFSLPFKIFTYCTLYLRLLSPCPTHLKIEW